MTKLPYTACLKLIGPDTVTLLERLVTCRVDDMSTGDQRPGALLTPQGKIIADFHLTRTQDGCDLQVHDDAVADLEKRLKMFRLRADVKIERTALPTSPHDELARIKSGLAVFGTDFMAADVFPTDINLDIRGGIDYKKGCFVGQEVVSRMKRRGKIRKRTIAITGKDLTKGNAITAGTKRLGQVTSAAQDHALAILRIDHLATALADGTPLTCEGATISPTLPDWLRTEMEALQNANT